MLERTASRPSRMTTPENARVRDTSSFRHSGVRPESMLDLFVLRDSPCRLPLNGQPWSLRERRDEAISERPDDVRHEIATSLLLLAMTCPFDVVAPGTGVLRSGRTANCSC
jgi:hypothetical protein